jgi:Ca2+-binding EF-hand superfamily protein
MANERMAKLALGLGVACLLVSGPALAADEQRLKRFFALMDEDGDGLVSRPEFQAEKGAVFLAIDRDGSMTLTEDEMRLSPEGFKLLAGADGVVDGEEFITSDITSFDPIDANKDHQIDFAELSAYITKFSE